MTPIRHRLPLLAALAASTALAAAPAIAQDARCPPLPAGSGLHWQQQAGDGFVVCRARDGERQVLGLMLTAKPTIKPLRRNRRALLKRLADRLGSVAAIEHLSA